MEEGVEGPIDGPERSSPGLVFLSSEEAICVSGWYDEGECEIDQAK